MGNLSEVYSLSSLDYSKHANLLLVDPAVDLLLYPHICSISLSETVSRKSVSVAHLHLHISGIADSFILSIAYYWLANGSQKQ